MGDVVEKFGAANQFYPTPEKLASALGKLIDWKRVSYILEPSAGKGDLCKSAIPYDWKRDILCVEQDSDLCSILRDKNYNVVQGDFLKFHTDIPIDCVIMNPPFNAGAAHLLHALSFITDTGGQLACILNAETLRNVCNRERQMLVQQLKQYGARVQYVENAFIDSDRSTNVTVAVIYVDIPKKQKHSKILEQMQRAQEHTQKSQDTENLYWLDNKDVIVALVQQYKLEIACGMELLREYEALSPHILISAKKDSVYNRPILELRAGGKEVTPQRYIHMVRRKYWTALFDRPEFMKRFTRDLRNTLMEELQAMDHYEFSIVNICQLYQNLSNSLMTSLDDTILNMFEQLTYKNSMGCENNIQYYNGWRTNDAFKINKRVVIPFCDTWEDYRKKYKFSYDLQQKLLDLERVLTYLGGNLPESWSVGAIRDTYYNEFKKVEFGYFFVTLYKKGTCHIEFKDETLLKRFNLYGAMKKGWLPGSYGYKTYEQMNKEEQAVVDSFEGKEQYAKDLSAVNRYLTTKHTQNTQMLLG